MRFRRDAPIVIISALTLALGVLCWASNAMFASQMAAVEARQFQQMRAVLEASVQGTLDRALASAETVARLPSVQSAFAAGDRPALLAELAPMYAVQHEKFGVDQAQFATLDNVSFLRLNAPDKIGGSLASFRPIIVAVNQDQVARKAMALGRSGPALVGVAPIFDADNRPIGIFEIGMEFGPVLDKLKAAHGFDGTFYIKEKPLREIATGVSPEVLDEHNRVGEYLKFSSTNNALARKLVAADDLARVNGDPVQYTRSAAGVVHGVILVALRNAGGESLGIISACSDFSATRAAAGRALVLQLSLGLFALVILSGVVIVVIRGFLLRPLAAINAGFDSVGREESPPAIDASPMCVELQVTAAHYERIRSARDRTGP